jgi:hypothetical protein
MGFGFCFVVQAQLPNPLCVLSKTQPRLDDEYTCGRLNRLLLAIGYWLRLEYRLTDHYFGYGLLVIGYGLEYRLTDHYFGYWLLA